MKPLTSILLILNYNKIMIEKFEPKHFFIGRCNEEDSYNDKVIKVNNFIGYERTIVNNNIKTVCYQTDKTINSTVLTFACLSLSTNKKEGDDFYAKFVETISSVIQYGVDEKDELEIVINEWPTLYKYIKNKQLVYVDFFGDGIKNWYLISAYPNELISIGIMDLFFVSKAVRCSQESYNAAFRLLYDGLQIFNEIQTSTLTLGKLKDYHFYKQLLNAFGNLLQG